MSRPRRLTAAAVVAALCVLSGCTSSGVLPPLHTSAPRSSQVRNGPTSCPSTYPAPDPNRPRMHVYFALSNDHTTVRGRETLSFRPDKPITEMVFRLTANSPTAVNQGNKIVVASASATPGGGRFGFGAAAAPASTQGGLLRIPFAARVPAGTRATARIDFTLTLGGESFDRFGRAGPFAYFGSGEPLLAWQRGFGWHTEDLLSFLGESATSEAMDVDMEVQAPAKDVVIASGDPAMPPVNKAGVRAWRSHLVSARDVSVAAGPFVVSDTVVNKVALRVGAASVADRDALIPQFRRAIVDLAKRYGPFPFPSLSVARLPASGGGIEYPSSILLLDSSAGVAVHETAHQYFYAMVGDSQALHPWLDEAFAQYSEELIDAVPAHPRDLTEIPGPVGGSTASFGGDGNAYYRAVYYKGSAALEAAGQAAGSARWAAALRCYVGKFAWRIADPADFQAAIAAFPAAVAILRKAGALP